MNKILGILLALFQNLKLIEINTLYVIIYIYRLYQYPYLHSDHIPKKLGEEDSNL